MIVYFCVYIINNFNYNELMSSFEFLKTGTGMIMHFVAKSKCYCVLNVLF